MITVPVFSIFQSTQHVSPLWYIHGKVEKNWQQKYDTKAMGWTNVWERVSLCDIFLESTRFCVCVCVTIFIFHNLKFWSEYVIFLAFLSPPFSFPLNFYARPVGLLWLIYLQLRSMLGKWWKRSFFPSGWLFFSEQFSPHFEFEIGACNGQSIFLCCLHDLLDSSILAWIPSHWLFVLCVRLCIATYFFFVRINALWFVRALFYAAIVIVIKSVKWIE